MILCDRLILIFLSLTVTLSNMTTFLLIVAVLFLSLGLSIDTFLKRSAALLAWGKGLFAKKPPAPPAA